MTSAATPIHRNRSVSPWRLGLYGWWKAGVRVYEEIHRDNLSLVSAGVAFFGFLAIFPGVAAFAAIYGLLFDPSEVEAQMSQLRGLLPPSTVTLLEAETRRLVAAAPTSLSWGAVIAVVVALYTTSMGSKGIIQATNLAYDREETRGFIRFNLIAFALTLGTIALLFVVLALVAGVPVVLAFAGIENDLTLFVALARWPVLACILLVALAGIYFIAPNRDRPVFRWVSPGSLLGTGLLIGVSGMFSLYVSNFGQYDQTYGSIGAVVIFMLWLYLASFIVLLGAELNAELEREADPEQPT